MPLIVNNICGNGGLITKSSVDDGTKQKTLCCKYSHFSNKRRGWNKRGGGPKFAKSLNVKVGINVEGGILWKKLMHYSKKRGVEGEKI